MNETSKKAEPRPHVLTIEDKKRITATGVDSVISFSPQQIVLSLDNGRLQLSGDKFRITSFSKSNGSFTADGVVGGVKYCASGGWKRLFR